MIRLDKYLCEMEAGTRSEVKAFIKKGRVTVNGETAKSPEQKVDETKDTVTLDGHSFSYQKYFYYMLHKPAGVVTAVRDHHDQTVLDLLVDAPGKDLSPVGRLDKDTEGLLLLTNDGPWPPPSGPPAPRGQDLLRRWMGNWMGRTRRPLPRG